MSDELVRRVNDLQRQVDNLIKPEKGRWVEFTPTLYQSAAVASTSLEGAYFVDNFKVNVVAYVTATAAGTIAQDVLILVPISSIYAPRMGANFAMPVGVFDVLDQNGGFYHGYAIYNGIVSGSLSFGGMAHLSGTPIGRTPSFALASTDIVAMDLTYRIS